LCASGRLLDRKSREQTGAEGVLEEFLRELGIHAAFRIASTLTQAA
jgi:hypothetical protein